MSDKPAEKAPNGAIPVVQADGTVGYLPAALADDPAATEGLTRATDDQIRGAQVKANKQADDRALREKFSGTLGAELEGAIAPPLAGAARGLTLGGSDVALGGLGDGVRKRLLDYQRYAPIASTAGELGAIAGSALLGDEAGLGAIPGAVGRLGAGAGEAVAGRLGGGLLARGAGVAAQGALEGGIYGAGNAISESALRDAPLTGEALIGGVAQGAAGGLIANGLLHGAGAAFKGLRGAVKPSPQAFEALAAREFGEAAPGIGEALAGDAEKAAAHPSDVKFDPATEGGPFRAPSPRNAADVAGEAYIDATATGQKRTDLGEIWKNREIAFQDGAERIENHSRDLQKAITEQQHAATVTDMATFGDAKVNHMDKLVDRTKFDDQADAVMNWMFKAQEQLNSLASDTAVTKLTPMARKEFEAQMARMGTALESGDSLKLFKAADDAKRFLGRHADFGKSGKGLTESARVFEALYKGDPVAGIPGLQHTLENPAWGEKAAAAQKAVNAATHDNISLGARFRAGFTTLEGTPGGRAEFMANSEKVSSFLGRLTKAANENDVKGVRDMIATRRKFLDATSESYDHGGAARTAIGQERSALDRMEATFDKATKETALINQAKRMQAEEQAQKIGGLIGLATDTLAKPVTTLQRLAQIEQHTKTVLDKLGGATNRLVGGSAEAAPKPTLAAPKGAGKGFFSLLLSRAPVAGERGAIAGAVVGRRDFDRRAEALAALQGNPAALSARVGAALEPFVTAAPKSTQAATAVAINGLSFLASKMPPSRQDPFTLQPTLQPASRASDSEISRHMRYVEAIDNPTMVLDEARKGTLTRDHVEAVKAVYPKLYAEMQQQVMRSLVQSKSELPYGRRIQLGILLDIPTDKTLSPDFQTAIQATYSSAESAGAESPPPSPAQSQQIASGLQTGVESAMFGGLGK